MTYKILRKAKQSPKNVNEVAIVKPDNSLVTPSPGRLFKSVNIQVPAKLYHNSTDMELLRLYTHGPLKWPDSGRTCGNCVNFYYDKKSRYGGRCKARGYMTTHEDTPADDTYNWVHPIEQENFPLWPGCPLFLMKERLSRR